MPRQLQFTCVIGLREVLSDGWTRNLGRLTLLLRNGEESDIRYTGLSNEEGSIQKSIPLFT